MIVELILIAELLEGSSVSPAVQPTTAKNGGWLSFLDTDSVTKVVQDKPVIVGKTFGESLTGLMYPEGWDADKIVLNLDPAAVEAFKQSEETKKALRGL